jgi:TolB-like protein
MADVFVSYSATDRERVQRLVEAFEQNDLTVWWDRGIGVGTKFDREIERELDGAGCVVVVWTRASVESEWVRNEAHEAQARDALIPVAFDDVRPPLAFRRAQTANMVDWPESQGEFDSVLAGIRRTLSSSAALTNTRHRAPAQESASLAVLPFANVSPDPEQVHFVDGLTIEMIHRLAKIRDLRVAGQTSSFAYKNLPLSVGELATKLGVAFLLEGSVRRVGTQLRVTVQLVNAKTGFQLWSADFDRHVDDLLEIQRDISDEVAHTLSLKLRVDAADLLGSTSNAAAHAHYLRGNALFWRQTPETTERAIAELEQAVAIDPHFGLAWVVLANTYGQRARLPQHTERSLDSMSSAVQRALDSEPLLWRAHGVHAWYLLSRRRFIDADRAMTEARRLQRSQESIVGPESMTYQSQVGRLRRALEEYRRVQLVDPVLGLQYDLLYALGRTDEAREAFAGNQGLLPWADREYLTLLAMDQSSAAAADAVFPGFSQSPLGRSWFGERAATLSRLRRTLAAGKRLRGQFAYCAMIASHHADLELAIEFLRAEYLADGFGAFYLMWNPALALVRTTAAFKEFLVDLGLPAMWRASGDWADFCEPMGEHDFACR